MRLDEDPQRFADVRKFVGILERNEGLADLVETVLRYPYVRRVFEESAKDPNPFEGAARRFGLSIDIVGPIEAIPKRGPVVFVANHGHGGADALALMAMMCQCRQDVRALANRQVAFLEGVSPYVFPVTLMDETSPYENTGSLRAMLKHVASGGCLGVFPAGRVAFWQGDRMDEPPWNNHVVRLLQRMEATIVPVWFHGSPPAAINLVSKLSPFLRAALIPTGLAWMRGKSISARVGTPFSTEILRSKNSRADAWLIEHLRSLRELGS